MFTKKNIIIMLAYITLFLLTFGIAIYGIKNQKTYDVVFKGLVYKPTQSDVYVNKNNHHIYVDYDNEGSYYNLKVENDDVIIKVSFNEDEYTIEKDGDIISGKIFELNEDYKGKLKDYYILVHSYVDNVTVMDEYPEVLIFSFLAIPPFIFGIILIRSLTKKIKNKKRLRIFDYIFLISISLIFTLSLSLLILIVYKNTP